MDIFDEGKTPKEKLIEILQVSGQSAVGLALDELIIRLLACEALLLDEGFSYEQIDYKCKDPELEEGMNDIYIDLQAKILSCE